MTRKLQHPHFHLLLGIASFLLLYISATLFTESAPNFQQLNNSLNQKEILAEEILTQLVSTKSSDFSFSKKYTDLNKANGLSFYILENNKGCILGVYKDEVLVGGAFFLHNKSRITYLFSSFTTKGRELQASSFLLSSIIKKYENSNLILDFEGGNMANIGSFYKSFGAKIEQYYFFKRTLL